MFNIFAIIIYIFEVLVGMAAIGFMGLIVKSMVDETDNDMLEKITSLILGTNDEGRL